MDTLGGLGILVLVGLTAVMTAFTAITNYISQNKTFFIYATPVLFVVVVTVLAWWAVQDSRKKTQEAALRLQRQAELDASIAKVRISDDRSEYIIGNNDYRRGTKRENFYRKAFLLPLLQMFGNRCAKCGTAENGVDIDHFVLSKNEGGCFALFHRDGYWVNNAIPLCQTCNRSKLDRSFRQFFAEEQLLAVFQKNAEMTKRLNDNPSMAQFRPESSAR